MNLCDVPGLGSDDQGSLASPLTTLSRAFSDLPNPFTAVYDAFASASPSKAFASDAPPVPAAAQSSADPQVRDAEPWPTGGSMVSTVPGGGGANVNSNAASATSTSFSSSLSRATGGSSLNRITIGDQPRAAQGSTSTYAILGALAGAGLLALVLARRGG